MLKLDLKDRKILYELDLNCRLSNSQIGKKVGLKRDVVGYRIKKLEDEGLIENYWTCIDTFRLGYNVFRIYINFQYLNPKIKQEIINHFVCYKNSWVVKTEKSEIDFAAIIWVKDIFKFYQFWNETLDNFEEYFEKYAMSIYIQANVFEKSYLKFDGLQNRGDREICQMVCGGKAVQIDELDYKLLNKLAEGARTPLVELAEMLSSSSQTISYRIKNLQKSGVIRAFRVNLNISKLNLQHFKVDIYLKEHKFKKRIFQYLQKKPFTEYINFAIGWSDLEPEFVVKNLQELLDILEEIKKNFPNSIKKQSFFITDKLYKLRCMPESEI